MLVTETGLPCPIHRQDTVGTGCNVVAFFGREPANRYVPGPQHCVSLIAYLMCCADQASSSWDISTMSIVGTIPAGSCSMLAMPCSNPGYLYADTIYSGRSVLCRDCDLIASSNLLDGVDWCSLSNFKLIASSKIPTSKSSSVSSMAYADSDNAIIIGGLYGRAYVVSCRTFEIQGELDNGGACAHHLFLPG